MSGQTNSMSISRTNHTNCLTAIYIIKTRKTHIFRYILYAKHFRTQRKFEHQPCLFSLRGSPKDFERWCPFKESLLESVSSFSSDDFSENISNIIHQTVYSSCNTYLTHWGRDKMAANFLMTFSNAFSWIKIYEFRLRFHWSLLPRVQLTIFQQWFR